MNQQPKPDALRMVNDYPTDPPSPGGEGRGEGEPIVRQGYFSVHEGSVLAAKPA